MDYPASVVGVAHLVKSNAAKPGDKGLWPKLRFRHMDTKLEQKATSTQSIFASLVFGTVHILLCPFLLIMLTVVCHRT